MSNHTQLKKEAVRRVNTQFLSAERVAEIINQKGIAECIAGVAAYIEEDFLRWNDFDKCARVANHSDVGVIELMPVADARPMPSSM
jgi:ornithine cyclodeaminase